MSIPAPESHEPLRWGKRRADRAHVAANIITGVCLLAILGGFIYWGYWGFR